MAKKSLANKQSKAAAFKMKVSINFASPLEKRIRIERGVVLLTGDVNITYNIKGEPMVTRTK